MPSFKALTSILAWKMSTSINMEWHCWFVRAVIFASHIIRFTNVTVCKSDERRKTWQIARKLIRIMQLERHWLTPRDNLLVLAALSSDAVVCVLHRRINTVNSGE